ncbi:hypothetical protein [Streptomyces flavofungini]|uniref:hypothetical protein n=1 Tax=Streptomyces flavofungini TaxID=68200 RepID=UPI0025AEDC67|nr:hypothetical protein [Streptomyces flavofungini]WJV50940.1 hypothetical protein QUY26_38840 [Streptomyces flavofungini]
MTPFSKQPDHTEHLDRIRVDLAELRQQVNDQRHAVDQARQDADAAITTGLAELRAVVRQGLDRGHDTLRDPLATLGAELVAIRAALNDISRGQRRAEESPRAPEEPPCGADEAGRQEGESVRHDEADRGHVDLLRKAAGISAAKVTVHRDTWAFLVAHAGQDRHFRIPGDVKEEQGAVTVDVSGLSLVAALTSLRAVEHAPGVDPGTAAIAHHLYERIAATVRSLTASPRPGAEPVQILIDDRAAPVTDEDQPSDSPQP